MFTKRSSGILMHPTSLPSRGGIGDLGPAAYAFVDWLAAAQQTLWQILPFGPVGYGNSPYSCTSAFAGNVLMISLERFVERGYLDPSRLSNLPDANAAVDFESVRALKLPLLREAARNFLHGTYPLARKRYDAFCSENEWWLKDYALFSVLREHFGDHPWNSWPEEIARRTPEALLQLRSDLKDQLALECFLQFAFFEQWRALRAYAADRGIRIIGDVAIFVSYDSADVWTHPDIFRLHEDLSPEFVAGVPPDAFSETGQRWGNPLYNWDALKARGYDWWIQRMRWAVETCDIVRLDHFRGYEACWEIPADEPTAVNGHWTAGPNEDLFKTLRNELGKLPFIAEDLGYITPEVRALRKKLDIPGMKVMQFGFGDRGAHIYLPHMFTIDSVVYTGTHDNNTTVGWWDSDASETEKRCALEYLGKVDDGINWAFIRAAFSSVAILAVIPVQDVLGLPGDARMNIPSKPGGNWSWRLAHGALTPELADKLAVLTVVTDRDASVKAPATSGGSQGTGMGADFAA
ncbi:MAG TPA: 4-alpha-glucanotransferase [Candidatus Limnocylindrales bacterium]|nr:4-alpha-glucanotransferase [Candidatus Limnocylindrales bacterium]